MDYSSAYWQKRQERLILANEKTATEYEKDLKRAYKQTLKDIQTEMAAFYGRYADKEGITLLQAKQRLTNARELKSFQERSKEYLAAIEKMDSSVYTSKYRSLLHKLSGKAYVTKMDELELAIRHHLETMTVGYDQGLHDTLIRAYEDSYYKNMFDMDKNMGLTVSFTAPGGKQLEAAVKEKWLGQNYSDRIWNAKDKLVKELSQLIPREFVRGRNLKQVSQDLADRMSVSYSNACRLIRTEVNHISNKATIQSYEDSGVVKQFEFVATLDNRTSEICQDMDGKVIDLKDAKEGITVPPMHPYCRSTTIPYFPKDEFGTTDDRIARNAEGKSEKLGKDITYKEWAKERARPEYAERVTNTSKAYNEMNDTPAKVVPEIFDAETVAKQQLIEKIHNLEDSGSNDAYNKNTPFELVGEDIKRKIFENEGVMRREENDLGEVLIPVEKLKAWQPDLVEEKLIEMVNNNVTLGNTKRQDITVALVDGQYVIVDGNHRSTLAKLLGMKEINVHLRKIPNKKL